MMREARDTCDAGVLAVIKVGTPLGAEQKRPFRFVWRVS